eukprot:m.250970 g.250970  ORF g.250970 m.250970 type:complete len:82 (-) comp17516_c1_seq68:7023-7268(-)
MAVLCAGCPVMAVFVMAVLCCSTWHCAVVLICVLGMRIVDCPSHSCNLATLMSNACLLIDNPHAETGCGCGISFMPKEEDP